MSTEVISVRIRKELKEEAKNLGINIKETIERALEEEIRKAKKEKMKKLIEEALNSINLTEEEWVKAVKETRLER
jgi:post-segregation antitoxin (ccd killing protein)